MLRKLSTPITPKVAHNHDEIVKLLWLYVHPLISANWFIFSRPGVLTRRKKDNLKRTLHSKDTRIRNKAILFSFNRTGSPNFKTADIWQRATSQAIKEQIDSMLPCVCSDHS